jgi:hypothetical protein
MTGFNSVCIHSVEFADLGAMNHHNPPCQQDGRIADVLQALRYAARMAPEPTKGTPASWHRKDFGGDPPTPVGLRRWFQSVFPFPPALSPQPCHPCEDALRSEYKRRFEVEPETLALATMANDVAKRLQARRDCYMNTKRVAKARAKAAEKDKKKTQPQQRYNLQRVARPLKAAMMQQQVQPHQHQLDEQPEQAQPQNQQLPITEEPAEQQPEHAQPQQHVQKLRTTCKLPRGPPPSFAKLHGSSMSVAPPADPPQRRQKQQHQQQLCATWDYINKEAVVHVQGTKYTSKDVSQAKPFAAEGSWFEDSNPLSNKRFTSLPGHFPHMHAHEYKV